MRLPSLFRASLKSSSEALEMSGEYPQRLVSTSESTLRFSFAALCGVASGSYCLLTMTDVTLVILLNALFPPISIEVT
jgi:hypothetical protein